MKLLGAVVLLSLAIVAPRAALAQDQPAVVTATPDNAKTFLGDWTVSANGNYGPTTMALSIKVTDGKVVGEITSDASGKQPITNITKSGTSLVLRYSFDYQGNPVNTVITLTPDNDKVNASLDFADGAAQMAGTATRKTN